MGGSVEPIDFAPFAELAALLYEGPWVTERAMAAERVLATGRLDPAVRQILAGSAGQTARDAFAAEYRRAGLQQRIHAALAGFDALLVPTAPTHYRLEEIEREPLALNSRLGTYTNFANLADLCALALPGPFRSDGLPAGITVLAAAWHDEALLEFGARWASALALPFGATGIVRAADRLQDASGCARLAVVGAHLRGLPLNHQLVERGARFVATVRSAPRYALHALPGTVPPKPGLVRRESGGASIELELWDLPLGQWGTFIAGVPAPLTIGTIELANGETAKGFLCEASAVLDAPDISSAGGWRAWLTR